MRTDTLRSRTRTDEPLVSDAELEHLRLITLQYRNRRYRLFPTGAAAGARPTRWRGQGMELHDARPYQPGDDIRHLDWRATARSGKPVTKIFVEERARNLFLLIDRRPSMMFGTRRELKAATAVRVAAILAFSALAEREAVSGLVIGEQPRYFPPAPSLNAVLDLLRAAAAPPPGPASLPDPAMAPWPLAHALPAPPERGTTCCLISDFHDVLDGRSGMRAWLPRPDLIATGGECIALRIVDIAERLLPEAGVLRLIPPGGGAVVRVDTGDADLRRHFREAIAERDARLRDECGRLGIGLVLIRNDLDLPVQLDALL
jgi:uncharacterized protein (DUF58 family)